jgi:hypothetical protein
VVTYRPVTYGAEPGPRAEARSDFVGVALLCVGVYLVGFSLLMLISPATFFAEIAPFGARNDHYIRDAATFQIALGAGALMAARRPSWRVPVLGLLCLQFALHSVNHLIDIDASDPAWLGPADFGALAIATALLAWLLTRALRQQPR